jgi:hypothetical protein
MEEQTVVGLDTTLVAERVSAYWAGHGRRRPDARALQVVTLVATRSVVHAGGWQGHDSLPQKAYFSGCNV